MSESHQCRDCCHHHLRDGHPLHRRKEQVRRKAAINEAVAIICVDVLSSAWTTLVQNYSRFQETVLDSRSTGHADAIFTFQAALSMTGHCHCQFQRDVNLLHFRQMTPFSCSLSLDHLLHDHVKLIGRIDLYFVGTDTACNATATITTTTINNSNQ
jgi:hypothetical protein